MSKAELTSKSKKNQHFSHNSRPSSPVDAIAPLQVRQTMDDSLAIEFIKAVKDGNIEFVKETIKIDNDIVNRPGNFGIRPLDLAMGYIAPPSTFKHADIKMVAVLSAQCTFFE